MKYATPIGCGIFFLILSYIICIWLEARIESHSTKEGSTVTVIF